MESDRTNTTSSDGSEAVQRARPLHGRTSGPTRRSTKGHWTPEEDEILRQAVHRFKGKNWKKIAECFKDRTDVQCLHRWQKVLNPELVKGPWSKEEDEVIIHLVNKYGPKKWSTIAQALPGRIGKQCRERWHNHLNPGINKEAWTQEEELALIRAHQIYGNKWAELTKFLPGRTDNAIKNHWNSSVKKKLDQYLASGLLQQFQGLPHVGRPNQSNTPSSSRMQQGSEDDSAPKDGSELEEISECSQGSTVVGCSQSTSDMGNGLVLTRDECQAAEGCIKKESGSSPVSCSENYLPTFQEVAFVIPEAPNEFGGSSVLSENNFTNEWDASMVNDWQINPNDLAKMISQDLAQESAGQFVQYLNGSESQQPMHFPFQISMSFTNMIVDGCFPSAMDMSGADGSHDPLLLQSLNYQNTLGSQSCYSSNPNMLASSYPQQPSVPVQLLHNDGSLLFDVDANQFGDSFEGNQEQESLPDRCDGFICVNESGSCPRLDRMEEQIHPEIDAPKVVAGSDLCSAPSLDDQTFEGRDPIVHEEQTDSGALCYEPPRFPSLDIPFFSCDLIQSGTDMLQEFSPLGTRQFWTSVNRLWDSPSGEKSPDALLRSAAKSYTCTPSILKKRSRDLVSPLSERRCEKKFESDLNQEQFSNLARDFSRLDVMFDEVDDSLKQSPSSKENAKSGEVHEDKENRTPDLGRGEMKDENSCKGTSSPDINCISCKEDANSSKVDSEGSVADNSASHLGTMHKAGDCRNENDDDCNKVDDHNAAAENANKDSGILIEHDINSLMFFSPDRIGRKGDRTVGLGVRALGNRYTRRPEAATDAIISSSEIPSTSLCSPRMSEKKDKNSNLVINKSLHSASSSTPEVNKVGISRTGIGVENISIFGETPYKRSIESPSAWKSPWFINSYLLGSRVDTDITIEDYGPFASPSNKSYDAIGLMKQLSEQTASAFANAQEVLGDETPETLLKKSCSKIQQAGETNETSNCELSQPPKLASSASGERRILDFSDCGTPGKGSGSSGKIPNALDLSSPSSYLLKGCR